ncbi:MAG: oxygenase MpaB family protein [Pseudomonadota bacterium]
MSDPKRPAFEHIVFRLAAYDFPWDIERALEFALFRTYAVPSISGLLAKTGEFETRTRKRYDDTELIMSEMVEHGLDSARGQGALARMNAMHAHYRISNDDMLYVLSTFVLEPIRWIDRFGWRKLTQSETEAIFAYYTDLGGRMGITDIPANLASFDNFNRAYEAAQFQYADSNGRIAKVTMDLMLGFYLPRAFWPLGRPVMRALMDPPLLQAMNLPPAPSWLQTCVTAGLKARAAALRALPKRRKPHLITHVRRPTYPQGYDIAELGTFPQSAPR